MQQLQCTLSNEPNPTNRIVYLSVSESEIRIQSDDSGPAVEQFFGHEDYEFWTTVSAEQMSPLVFALLKERYLGNERATDDFKEFCTAHSIPFDWGTWSS